MNARLHLGCGPGPQPDGWIHLDGSWNAWLSKAPLLRGIMGTLKLVPLNARQQSWEPQIIVANLRRRLPFAEDNFDAVYSSHVLEHLYEDETADLLRECARVLRPGGILRLVVPDLRALAIQYLERKRLSLKASDPQPADWLNETLHLRSKCRPRGLSPHRLYTSITEFHSHKWMYDAQSLASRMMAAGLGEVQERSLWDSKITGIEFIEKRERIDDGAGVCVEGMKVTSSLAPADVLLRPAPR